MKFENLSFSKLKLQSFKFLILKLENLITFSVETWKFELLRLKLKIWVFEFETWYFEFETWKFEFFEVVVVLGLWACTLYLENNWSFTSESEISLKSWSELENTWRSAKSDQNFMAKWIFFDKFSKFDRKSIAKRYLSVWLMKGSWVKQFLSLEEHRLSQVELKL